MLASCKRSAVGNDPDALVAISFAGASTEAQDVTIGGTGSKKSTGRQDVSARENAGEDNSLQSISETFTIWGYKNESVNVTVSPASYGDAQVVFPGYKVSWYGNSANSTTSNVADWEYVGNVGGVDQQIKFWDFGAKAYRFFGYAPADAADGADAKVVVKGVKTDDTEVDVDASNMNDLKAVKVTIKGVDATKVGEAGDETPVFSKMWFSNNSVLDDPNMNYGKTVKMKFVHPVSKVRLMFVDSYGLEYNNGEGAIDTASIRFAPTDTEKKIYTQGDVTVSYPLSGSGTSLVYAGSTPDTNNGVLTSLNVPYSTDKDYVLVTAANVNKWYTVLPNMEQTNYTLSVRINGEDKTAVVPAVYMQWRPGYSYTYVFKVLDNGGVVLEVIEAAIKEWTEGETVDKEIYNW